MNLKKLGRRREYLQLCNSCSEKLELRNNCSSYNQWKQGLCNKCRKNKKLEKKRRFASLKKNPRKIKRKAKKIKDSVQQRILFEELKRRLNPKYLRYNFPVRTWTIRHEKFVWNIRYIDIADIRKKVAFEYDGEQWHNNAKKDRRRDRELKRINWKVVHVNKYNIQQILDKLVSKLR